MTTQVTDDIRRCAQCIVPEGYPDVTLNQESVCSHCQTYQPKEVLGEAALWDTLKQRQGSGRYDVLVPVSGGRDSSFVLYHAVRQFGKRVFALHFDNDFQVPQARQNFLNVVEKFGVDYTIEQSKYHLPIKIVHHAVKTALPFGKFDLTTNCCVACTYGYRAASYRKALKLGIPTILWGDSDVEAISFFYRQSRIKYFFSRYFYHYLLFILYTMLFQFEFWIPKSRFFHLSAPTYSGDEILDVHFFDYVEWDRETIKKTIMNEVGWKAPDKSATSWRFDCTIHHVVNYCFKQTYGFSKDFDGFANMVRAGKMDRQEALQQEKLIGEWDDEMGRILSEDFNLSEQEITRYFGIH
ncbi:hypothetical protein CSA56_04995 [candidate division KSB3 bacterium]|uniref:Uncharacterized protein n=1 Tax=candidate division KSB3 bacterium TaxID=2044937 RepID=A0A2G6KHU6_9BACT|nr:MAG: hypothetical protein CSA56_04995 [candidate division KSB3 bacterium]